MIGFPKPSRTASRKATVLARGKRVTTERTNKAIAKRRDHYRCRFPLCGCKRLGLRLDARLESSHDRHKGAGGNPAGDRSTPDGLITLCLHRHQDGAISRHKGTLRTRHLTDKGNDGPVAWDIDMNRVKHGVARGWRPAKWVEVAREKAVQVLDPPTPAQLALLERLAEMDL